MFIRLNENVGIILQTWKCPGLQKIKANIMAIINKDESAIFPKEEYEGTYKRFIEYLKSLLSSSDNKSNAFFHQNQAIQKNKMLF